MELKEVIEKLLSFFILCMFVVGSLGGVIYLLTAKQYFVGVCAAVVVAMALPVAKTMWNILNK